MKIGARVPSTARSVLSMKIFFACFLVVGVIAAIAYHLHGSYLLGQFDSAIATTYELVAAETRFARAHPDRGYTCDLSQLIKEGAQFGEHKHWAGAANEAAIPS